MNLLKCLWFCRGRHFWRCMCECLYGSAVNSSKGAKAFKWNKVIR